MTLTQTLDELVRVLKRLAETQQNLPVPMTEVERQVLREASRLLGRFARWEADYHALQRVINGD